MRAGDPAQPPRAGHRRPSRGGLRCRSPLNRRHPRLRSPAWSAAPGPGRPPSTSSTTTRSGGRRCTGTTALFERLCLEAFQSGLSWITILRKRPAFRSAFAGFAIDAVAEFGPDDEARLMADAGIVRNRAKIAAAIRNARTAQQQPEGLSELLWSFAPTGPRTRPATVDDVPATSAESVAMARELKRRGFVFVGPTTAYALMQATGMVDDHVASCFRASP
ncbi:DNA-3-methyladenine glycosylase I [Blastococcus sp. TML/C7B]|uniref:DNA-3-methyladenine glycosylase I n=1 Tax=Blastococcus sp. TML/C7B TaxID=2798728 RepID=UPI0028164765|nr:DNA-3-methyladenine glycosylase I [Blastococcus sp. TML/C7B]